MPKYKISYYGIPYGGGIFSVPAYERSEFIEIDSNKLQKYIESQKDSYGCSFKKDKSFGFDYISNQGGAKVEAYKPPKFKTPTFKKIK